MLRVLPHTIGLVIPVAILLGAWAGGAWTFLAVGLLYGGMPVIDALAGLNPSNPSEDAVSKLNEDPWFRAITWGWVPIQLGLISWTLWLVARPSASIVEPVGLTLSLGMASGAIGITFAHELIHRPGKWERALGEVLLASVSYPHYAIEHVYGHHRYVGTRRDPATSRLGETLYRFLPRTVFGSVRSAWDLERRRLLKRQHTMWSWRNRFLRYVLTQALIYAVLFAWLGAAGVIAFATQALVAVLLLETINYIEHYGLERKELSPGRYEPVLARHSWNSSHRVSNWLLINLARHTDHHLVASKRYQVLNHLEEAPQLPAGYGTMIIVAMVPPLWRRLMDSRAARWRY